MGVDRAPIYRSIPEFRHFPVVSTGRAFLCDVDLMPPGRYIFITVSSFGDVEEIEALTFHRQGYLRRLKG